MKTRENSYTMKNVLKLAGKLSRYSPRMAATIICGILHQLSLVAVAAMSAYIVGVALEGGLTDRMPAMIGILTVLILSRVAFFYAEMWLAHDVAFKVLRDFRVMLLDAIERVSPSILFGMRSGELASTLMGDVEILEWFFAHTFGAILVAVIVPAILLYALGTIHFSLPLIMLFFLTALIAVPFVMKRKASRQGQQVRDEFGEASAITVEGVQGLREILMLGSVDEYRKKNRRYMQKVYDSQLDYGKRLGTEGAILQFISGLSMLAVAGVSAFLALSGQMAFTSFTVAVMLAALCFNPVIEICNTARNFGLIFASANRVFMVIEAEPTVRDAGRESVSSAEGWDVSFENVSFRYREDLPRAVDGVSFTVKRGETVALVGSSGAGKSTCVNLLLRYWDAETGSIKIGGRDIRDISLNALRKQTSAVLQDVFLFHDSLRENIRLGKIDATDEEVEIAAKEAHIHNFIMSLPKGYDAMAGERGVHLSGGQRQRIAIARAILQNSSILILDEAVSSLDAENESEIQKVLTYSGKNRTTLIVAHRLSTIMSADRLVVIKDGRVVQTGTHAELIAVPGTYRSLIASQTGAEQSGKR